MNETGKDSMAEFKDVPECNEKNYAAFMEMKNRNWGFAKNKITGTFAVGPIDQWGWITVYGFDTDFAKAIEKAVQKSIQKKEDTAVGVVKTE